MLNALKRACEDGGKLLGVSRTLYRNDPRFITTFSLRFETLTLGFRADADLDILEATIGQITTDDDEVTAEIGGSAPWVECVGCVLSSAWWMTNQKGYADGVRLEFDGPCQPAAIVVELMAVTATVKVFKSTTVRPT